MRGLALRRIAITALTALALAAALPRPAAAADGGSSGPEVLEDEWMLVRINGEPAGYGHGRVVRERREGVVHIISTTEQRMGVTRMGFTITVEERSSFTERESGEPVSFRSEEVSSKEKKITRGVVRGDKLELKTTVMGTERTSTVDWAPDIRFAYGIEQQARKLTRPGQKVSVRTYLPQLGQATLQMEAKGYEVVRIGRKRMKLFRIDNTGALPGITVTEYRDHEGHIVLAVTPVMGMKITIEKTDRETALRLGSAAAGIDMIAESFVRPKINLPHPKRLEGCTYRLTFRTPKLEDVELGADERQEVLSQKVVDGRLVMDLRVKVVLPKEPGVTKRPDAKYLASTSTLQADDEMIVRLARQATMGIDGDFRKAKALERWVSRNINKKGLDVGFATAKEVARTRAGDCTEHAVLLAAMLRAVGIPSKGSAGLVYFKGIFGYHMWAEAWIDGSGWIALDATLAKPFVDATHIEFSDSDLGDESPMKSFTAVIGQVAGKLDMRIIDFTMGGRTVKIADLGEPNTLEAGLYTDKLNAFSFRLGGGWKLIPRAERPKSLAFSSAVFERAEGAGKMKIEVLGTPYEFSFGIMPLMLAQRYSLTWQSPKRIAGRRCLAAEYVEKRGRPTYNALFVLDDDVLISIIGQDLGDGGAELIEKIEKSLEFLRPVWAGPNAGD